MDGATDVQSGRISAGSPGGDDGTPVTEEEPLDDEEPLDTEGKNPNAVALGRLGGKKGGKARAAQLTPEQRSQIAKNVAAARWARQSP